MSFIVDIETFDGCVYLDWSNSKLPSLETLIKAINKNKKLTGNDKLQRPMLIVGCWEYQDSCRVTIALERSNAQYEAIALDEQVQWCPKSYIIDRGSHIAFAKLDDIPIGKKVVGPFLRAYPSPHDVACKDQARIIEEAASKWNEKWQRRLRKTKG